MLDVLQHMLEQEGCTDVVCMSDGTSALAWLDAQAQPAQMVVLDINMPGMDGVEFVRHLAERKFTGSLLLVSGEDELLLQATEKLARAYELETATPLRKPPTPDALRAALAQLQAPKTPGRRQAKRKQYSPDEVLTAIQSGQLVNWYQPKVAVKTGEVVGAEALVRWQHPTDGLVFPDQFIPIAEAGGFINELTRVVARAAVAQAREWLAAGLKLRVAINVSMDDLATLALADRMIAKTEEGGVPPQFMQIEITESRLMKSVTSVLDQLIRLRLKRFRLSIDDFGSGHSSLVQLRDLPFDELKIDRSFTHNASHDARLRAIFAASLNLGRTLGMEVVAEGVEDRDDWDFLIETGVNIAQGYFIARPMPAAAMQGWLHEWEARLWQDGLLPTETH
ncbi:MAG: EAL domain-containing response regulator [Burkholderiaceae bacterium]|nr:EAL domain-containing response regulator [Rhodoferax sp.]MCP5286446.1 EAL domain-containing response regulator [Burkholderiaceae bacterium]